MAAQTPNLGLYKPELTDTKGQTIGTHLPANMDVLDTKVLRNEGGTPAAQSGLDADKPAAGLAGRLYIATDTLRIYRDTGTAWDVVATIQHTHTGGSDGPQIDPSAFATANWPAFRAYQSTLQSIAAATWTKIAYQTEVYDQGGVYDNTIYRFTASAPGIYLFGAYVGLVAGLDGERHIVTLYVNGLEHSRLSDQSLGGANAQLGGGGLPLKLAAGDYVEVFAYSSNARDTSSSNYTTHFSAVRVA